MTIWTCMTTKFPDGSVETYYADEFGNAAQHHRRERALASTASTSSGLWILIQAEPEAQADRRPPQIALDNSQSQPPKRRKAEVLIKLGECRLPRVALVEKGSCTSAHSSTLLGT